MRVRTPQAKRWPPVAERALSSSRILFQQGEFRGSVNRSSYAVYQVATALSVEHGDVFPNGWNNPMHDQLPGLITNNRLLAVSERHLVSRTLERLRSLREDADYRPGRTIDNLDALQCLFEAEAIFDVLPLKESV